MKQLCLSRQYFLFRDFAGFGVSPEAEARIIQPAAAPSTTIFQVFSR
jgi:hypothetical protein